MPLQFPAVEDVPLGRTPLTAVLCQVRFPPILRISRGQPFEFQEAIRKRFPELEEEHGFQVRVTAGAGAQVADAEATGRSFNFRTADGETLVTLAVDAYAISTSRYTVWEAFAEDLTLVHEAVMAAYGLPYAKRVGLRYVNQFDAEHTGCTTFEELKGFLRPELVASMATDVWDRPEELVSQILLEDGSGRLVLRVVARAAEQQPPVVALDLDYYEEGRVPVGDLVERCGRFHDVVYRAFRWSLQPDKMVAFAPVTKET